MKLLRFGPVGQEKPGILDAEGRVRDLSGKVPDFAGDGVSFEALDAVRAIDVASLPVVEQPGRIGAALGWVPNFYCIGLNYARHAREAGMAAPDEPILFSKATTSLSGPNDPVIIPRASERADWEVELGVVIGKRTLYVSEAEALSCVAGYCTINDVSEREFQIERSGQWMKGKSAPSFGPVGPWLVTPDAVADPQDLDLALDLNGVPAQRGNTRSMIFTVTQVISYLSQVMTLHPGDIIATGTPPGVGMGQDPQVFLKPGDEMELRINGLGTQRQTVLPPV